MKTKFIKIDGWQDVLNACRHTVNKAPLAKEPSSEFKKGILIAEHGPLERWWLSGFGNRFRPGFPSTGYGISGNAM